MHWISPVKIPPGSIGQPFGAHWIDYSQFGWLGHNGQDYPAPKGTPIYAVYDGYIVEQTAKETGYGLRISQRIDDGNKHYLVVYGHMERLENPVDVPYNWKNKTRPVKQGQIIGYVDSTGFSTGNHLHLGLYEQLENGQRLNSNNGYGGAIDPMPFIKADNMSNVIFIHKTGTKEYGFYIPATNEDTIKDKALNYGMSIQKPDGSVDFSSAKEVSGL